MSLVPNLTHATPGVPLFAARGAGGGVGAVGPAGPKGDKGDRGDTGPAGAAGAQGPAGPAGATGAQGPAGPKGDTGAQGPQGPAGSSGASAVSVPFSARSFSIGPGSTAYLSNGFTLNAGRTYRVSISGVVLYLNNANTTQGVTISVSGTSANLAFLNSTAAGSSAPINFTYSTVFKAQNNFTAYQIQAYNSSSSSTATMTIGDMYSILVEDFGAI